MKIIDGDHPGESVRDLRRKSATDETGTACYQTDASIEITQMMFSLQVLRLRFIGAAQWSRLYLDPMFALSRRERGLRDQCRVPILDAAGDDQYCGSMHDLVAQRYQPIPALQADICEEATCDNCYSFYGPEMESLRHHPWKTGRHSDGLAFPQTETHESLAIRRGRTSSRVPCPRLSGNH